MTLGQSSNLPTWYRQNTTTNTLANHLSYSEPLQVDICWYGQRECDTVPVVKNPLTKACAGERAVTYDVVTGKENFIKYLSAAKKLFLKIVAANRDVGYASIDRLGRIHISQVYSALISF